MTVETPRDRVRLKIKKCRNEIKKFDEMTASNEKSTDCLMQLKMVIASHVDVMEEALKNEDTKIRFLEGQIRKQR